MDSHWHLVILHQPSSTRELHSYHLNLAYVGIRKELAAVQLAICIGECRNIMDSGTQCDTFDSVGLQQTVRWATALATNRLFHSYYFRWPRTTSQTVLQAWALKCLRCMVVLNKKRSNQIKGHWPAFQLVCPCPKIVTICYKFTDFLRYFYNNLEAMKASAK